MLPLILSIGLASIAGFWLLKLIPDKKIILIYLVLTLISPWFLILFLGQNPFGIGFDDYLKCNQGSVNRTCFLSFESLFFVGDPRENVHIEDQGFFLLSTLPLMLIGLYLSIRSGESQYNVIFTGIILALIISFFLDKHPNLGSSFWYLPFLEIFMSLGAYNYLKYLRRTKVLDGIKLLIIVNVIWIFYETLRLYQILLIHQPFKI